MYRLCGRRFCARTARNDVTIQHGCRGGASAINKAYFSNTPCSWKCDRLQGSIQSLTQVRRSRNLSFGYSRWPLWRCKQSVVGGRGGPWRPLHHRRLSPSHALNAPQKNAPCLGKREIDKQRNNETRRNQVLHCMFTDKHNRLNNLGV